MGLLGPSFVPPPEIRAQRDLTRARLQLVRDRTREWQRLEKLLKGALVKLSSVVSSLARTKTARVILEALAGGEGDPRALAAAQVKGGRAAIERSLDGMMIGGHHPMLIRAHLDHITLLERTAAALEAEAALGAIPAARGITADGVPSAGPGRTRRPCPRRNGSRRSPAPRRPVPSSAKGSAACPAASAAAGPDAPSPGPSSSSSHWHLLADPEARFRDLGPDWHARSRDRKIQAHLRQLRALGLDVTITPAA